MKSEEELKQLKEEYKKINQKLNNLSLDDLVKVVGGISQTRICPICKNKTFIFNTSTASGFCTTEGCNFKLPQ